jgi:hypothetical protein
VSLDDIHPFVRERSNTNFKLKKRKRKIDHTKETLFKG